MMNLRANNGSAMNKLECWLILAVCAFLGLTPYALAERVNRCSMRTVSQPSGTTCHITAKKGEVIKVWAQYRDTTPDSARVTLSPFGQSITVAAGTSRILSNRILDHESGPIHVSYSIPNFASGDYLDIEVYSDRSNLRMNAPSISATTGELIIPWDVTTVTPFHPVAWTTIGLWATVNERQYTNYLGTWTLEQCIGRGRCPGRVIVPLAERSPISRGLTRIEAYIDSEQNHSETDEHDNYRSTYLDDFFSESIPGIMNAKGWGLAASLLNRWFDHGRLAKSPTIASFDWNLPSVPVADTDWFLDPNNASNNRFIQRFNRLAKPNEFNTPNFRTVLRQKIVAAFAAAPSASSVPLSSVYRDGVSIRSYHEQHMQNGLGQSSTITLDGVTAAFGNFNYYLVPRGAAVKRPQKYEVTINKVAIHVLDSFDFNGSQQLGCWGLPDRARILPGLGLQCFSNNSFQYYRNMKARGRDYNVFTRPKIVTLATPLVINFPR